MAQDEYTQHPTDEPMAARLPAAALEELGRALRSQRQLSNLSQTQLAVGSGVAQKVISRLERGEINDPSFADLALLAHALNLRPGAFAEALGLPVRPDRPELPPVDADPRGAWIQQHSRGWTADEVDLYLDLAYALAQRIEGRRQGPAEDTL